MNRWLDRMAPHAIFCLTTCMVLFGLVMVYSSSAFIDYRSTTQKQWEQAVDQAITTALQPGERAKLADEEVVSLEGLREQDTTRRASMLSTFIKQACWVLLGFFALAFAATVDYPLWGKRIGLLLLTLLALQVALFVLPCNSAGLPIQAREINGSRSWIQVLGFRLQPSELAKLVLVIFSAWYLSRRIEKGPVPFFAFLPALPIFAISIGMILAESDKGVAIHLCLSILILWIIAVGRFSQVLILGAVAAVTIGILISFSAEAQERLYHFFGPDSFQLRHSKEALSRGGLLGTGLGDGDAALSLYLFGANTDFILATIGEELGFAVTSAVVLGYLAIILIGLKVASSCGDPFGTLLALGITVLIGSQAFLNMAVVTGLAPTTGFTLPLLSYGGSSLTWTMIAIGILINISLSTHNQLLSGRNRVKPGPFGTGRVAA